MDIICFLWGNWFNKRDEYLIKLKNMLNRNISIPYRFLCISDKDIKGIETLLLNPQSNLGNLPKLSIFSYHKFLNKQIFLIDLDIIILNNIDHILTYETDLCIRAEHFKKINNQWVPDGDLFLSNISNWSIVNDYINDNIKYIERVTKGRERYFYKKFYKLFWPKIEFFQEVFPDEIQSYKQNRIRENGLKENIKIVSFHGHPKPHEVYDKWIKNYWK